MSRRVLALVFLAAALILSGCERAEDDKAPRGSFELVRPLINEQVISTDGKIIRVNYNDRRTLGDHESVIIKLNGVSLFEAAENIGTFAYIPSASAWVWHLDGLTHRLNQGNNTIHVEDTITGQQDSLTFFFDNQAPKLIIDNVEVVGCAGFAGVSDLQGCDIVLYGSMQDASNVISLRFNSGGVSVPLQRTDLNNQDCPADADSNLDTFSNRERAGCPAKTFRVTLPYPDTGGRTTEPHFSYTIEDRHGHSRTERFAAWDANIRNNMALQFNNSLLFTIKPLVDPFIRNMVEHPEISAALPDFFTAAIDQAAPGFCGGMVLNASQCEGVAESVDIINPRLATGGFDRNGYRAKLGFGFDAIRIGFRIRGYDNLGNYLGSFSSTVVLEDFELFSHLSIKPATGNRAVDIERLPLKLWLNPGWHGLNRQAVLHNSRCSNSSICAIDPNLLEFGFNLRLTADGRELADNLLDDIPAAIEGAEFEVGDPPQPKTLGAILDDWVQGFVDSQTSSQKVSHVYATYAHPINTEPRNALLRIAGGYDVSEPNPLDIMAVEEFLKKAGLGSLFKNITHEMWYTSKEPGGQGRPIDFGMAISANMVNQFLLAEHQSGAWENKTREFENADLKVLGIDDPLDIELSFKTNQAPRAHFTGYKKTGGGFKIELVGLGEIGTIREDIPGNIRFAADDFEITVRDLTDPDAPVVVMDLNANISVHLCMELVGDLPQIKPFFKGRCEVLSGFNRSRFVSLQVNELNMAAAYQEQQTEMQASAAITQLLSEYFIEQLQNFNQQKGFVLNARNDLFGMAEGFRLCLTNNPDHSVLVYERTDLVPNCSVYMTNEGISGNVTLDTAVDQLLTDVLTIPRNPLPIEYGIEFREFEIEPTGQYFSMSFDVQVRSAGPAFAPCPNSDTDNYDPTKATFFRAYCIQQ